ncbi:MAG TPA: hypothetical protein VGF46_01345 [Gaiellales bacterium]|jgi:hypothetical protein
MNYPDTNEMLISDERFMALVARGRIERFGHREHLRLAFVAARSSETPGEVVDRCRAGIRAVALAHGAPGTYHETITAAWAAIMLDAVRSLPGSTFDELVAARPELADPAYLERHYSPDLLASGDTRTRVFPPDRATLPD